MNGDTRKGMSDFSLVNKRVQTWFKQGGVYIYTVDGRLPMSTRYVKPIVNNRVQ
jgi:hypothetical protein